MTADRQVPCANLFILLSLSAQHPGVKLRAVLARRWLCQRRDEAGCQLERLVKLEHHSEHETGTDTSDTSPRLFCSVEAPSNSAYTYRRLAHEHHPERLCLWNSNCSSRFAPEACGAHRLSGRNVLRSESTRVLTASCRFQKEEARTR